jgi:hypothetical protein
MTTTCDAPLPDDTLVDYWSGDLTPAETDVVEEHVFACARCAAQLETVAGLAGGVAALARQGRISGIISRALLNQLQRQGVRVRLYSLAPGEVVPCAAFPDDDLVVVSVRGDFAGIEAITLSVTGAGDTPLAVLKDVPVSRTDDGLLWATPGAMVRRLPTARVTLTVTAGGESGRRLGEYVLDHTAQGASAE